MVSRVVTAALAVCLFAFGQAGTYTVNQLREFLRSTMQNKTPDVEVAKFLRDIRLSEKLEDQDIETLQGQGLGPKTVAALKKLRDSSASLRTAQPEPPPPPKPKEKAPPSSEEQARIIEQAREHSLNYTNSLPDYLCMQVTRRYANPYGKDNFTHPYDTLVERLSYVNHHEEYKTVTKNNQVTDVDAIKLGGSLSRGEFGSMLREIFEHKSRTEFDWERWTRFGDRLTYVFAYRVPLETSEYRIDYEGGKQVITVGYHGSIFIDKETNMVRRIKMEADIPAGFPVQQTSQQLDYDYQKIGDQEFLLPLVSEMRGKIDGRYMVKNTINFQLYRKFSADAQIKFDSMLPETPPEEEKKLKEQPPQK